ncbi:MAG: D-glycero-beta-D-manno-heptose 1-phosphate adenylyltransferase [Fidelibacterota bacterium]
MIVDSWEEAKKYVESWKSAGETIVFTNGCFDLLHRGHVEYLEETKSLGDKLILALNSDQSVQKLKGNSRPILHQDDRAVILDGLKAVDLVVIFDQETPTEIIECLLPDILAKGGDYTADQVMGADVVKAHGGKVVIIPFRPSFSSSDIIKKIIKLTKPNLKTP